MKIRWLTNAIGRVRGYEETYGQEGSIRKWLKLGLIEIVEGRLPELPDSRPIRDRATGSLSTRSFQAPPVHRAIQAPIQKATVKKKDRNPTKLKMRRGRR